MNLRILGVALLGLLIFVLGFALGGIRWSWRSAEHAGDVAFWGMLGAWVSGLATVAAVTVSLWMAYQSSQSDVEKISITASCIDKLPFGESYTMNIRVKNLKNVHVVITDLKLYLPELRLSLSLNDFFADKIIWSKCILERKGDYVDFPLVIDSGVHWWGKFFALKSNPEIKFKNLKLQVYTAIKSYQIPLGIDLSECLKERFSAWFEINV